MKALLLIAIYVFSGAMPCHARLGETLAQCIARYGSPIDKQELSNPSGIGGGFTGFKKNRYFIAIIFFKDVASYEFITKTDDTDLSSQEQQALLDAEAQDSHWTREELSTMWDETWRRDDGALASYKSSNRTLTFLSVDFQEAVTAKKRLDTQTKLKDF